MSLAYTLIVRRGAPFHAHAWPLVDSVGNPVRDPTGLSVVAKIRAWPGAEMAVVMSSSLVMLTIPGHYADEPVVCAQLNAMTTESTAAWFELTGQIWELAINGDTVVSGSVATPWAVAR